jgi:hypothetical protein
MDDASRLAVVSRRILEGAEAARVWRVTPEHDRDSGWRAIAGGDSERWLRNPANVAAVMLQTLFFRIPELEWICDGPVGSDYERDDDGEFELTATPVLGPGAQSMIGPVVLRSTRDAPPVLPFTKPPA